MIDFLNCSRSQKQDMHIKRVEICHQCGKGFAKKYALLCHQKTHKRHIINLLSVITSTVSVENPVLICENNGRF